MASRVILNTVDLDKYEPKTRLMHAFGAVDVLDADFGKRGHGVLNNGWRETLIQASRGDEHAFRQNTTSIPVYEIGFLINATCEVREKDYFGRVIESGELSVKAKKAFFVGSVTTPDFERAVLHGGTYVRIGQDEDDLERNLKANFDRAGEVVMATEQTASGGVREYVVDTQSFTKAMRFIQTTMNNYRDKGPSIRA